MALGARDGSARGSSFTSRQDLSIAVNTLTSQTISLITNPAMANIVSYKFIKAQSGMLNSLNQIGAEYLNAFSRICRAMLTRATDPDAEGFPPEEQLATEIVAEATSLLTNYFAPKEVYGS